MIFNFIRDNASQFPIENMAYELNVSSSGYYKFINRKESLTDKKNNALVCKIKLIHQKSRSIYGSPRITAELNKQCEKCSRKRVAKLMRQNGIQSKIRVKWKATTKGT